MCGLCKDCKYWDTETYYTHIGVCYSHENLNTEGYCTITESDGGEPNHKDTLAYARDTEGGSADLITKENFGCVQFASKK